MLEETFIGTRRGAVVRAVVHRPETPRAAAVVFAPGSSYHCEMPLIRESALELERRRFLVLRFDWAFQTRLKEPSGSFDHERDDLASAVAEAAALPGVRKVVLVGKSLGALLGLELAARVPLAGLLLLTVPVEGLRELRPPALSVPAALITGDADPAASLDSLRAEAESGHLPRDQVILPGGHDLVPSVPQAVREVVQRSEGWLLPA